MTKVSYGRGPVVFTTAGVAPGRVLLAATERGVCSVALGTSDEALEQALRERDPTATRNDEALRERMDLVLRYLGGEVEQIDLLLDIGGTPFQRQVWEAILAIPYGETCSYQQLSQAVQRPTAVRAVAGACGANPVPLIVPCHRVIRSNGELGGFGAGLGWKRALLDMEAEARAR